MFDTEKFIVLIQSNECLWQLSNKKYSDRNERAKAWDEICAGMFEKWDELSTTEKVKKGLELQKKWKNIKDSFSKEVKSCTSEQSGAAAKKKRKYVYFDILQFLIPELEGRRTESNIEQPQTAENTDDNDTPPQAVLHNNDPEEPQIDPPSPRPKQKTKTTKKGASFEAKLLEVLQESTRREENNEDAAFFKSLIPSIRSLNETQKLEFRMGVLQLLKTIKTSTSSITTNSPYSQALYHQPPPRQSHSFWYPPHQYPQTYPSSFPSTSNFNQSSSEPAHTFIPPLEEYPQTYPSSFPSTSNSYQSSSESSHTFIPPLEDSQTTGNDSSV